MLWQGSTPLWRGDGRLTDCGSPGVRVPSQSRPPPRRRFTTACPLPGAQRLLDHEKQSQGQVDESRSGTIATGNGFQHEIQAPAQHSPASPARRSKNQGCSAQRVGTGAQQAKHVTQGERSPTPIPTKRQVG